MAGIATAKELALHNLQAIANDIIFFVLVFDVVGVVVVFLCV